MVLQSQVGSPTLTFSTGQDGQAGAWRLLHGRCCVAPSVGPLRVQTVLKRMVYCLLPGPSHGAGNLPQLAAAILTLARVPISLSVAAGRWL